MKRIRVLQVVGAMNMGGIENFVMNLFRAADREHFQFDFLYITPQKCYFDDEIEQLGGRIFRITGRNTDLRRHNQELRAFFLENRDIACVHIHASNAFCYNDARIAKKCGIKQVFVHSHSTNAPHRQLHYLAKTLLPIYADKYLACSDLAAKWMFPPRAQKKVLLIPNGIFLSKYSYSEETANRIREQYGLQGKLVIGHVGRMEAVKNHAFLIDTLAQIQKTRPDAVLLLIGDGSLRSALEEKIEQLHLQDSVIFAGIQNNVHEYLQAFDVMAFPSLYEGLPVTLVEAQASGVPCYISDVITRDVAVTALANYLPLSLGAQGWAERILQGYGKYGCHPDCSAQIRDAGFDIAATAAMLEDLYRGK